MNKEKEALLKEILAEPDNVPHKVSMKSILRLLERMQPKTEEMRDYLIAFYSAGSYAECEAVHDALYATFTPEKAKAFDEAYLQCMLNDLGISEETLSQRIDNQAFIPLV
jgi:hypothetical protein